MCVIGTDINSNGGGEGVELLTCSGAAVGAAVLFEGADALTVWDTAS